MSRIMKSTEMTLPGKVIYLKKNLEFAASCSMLSAFDNSSVIESKSPQSSSLFLLETVPVKLLIPKSML